MKTSAQIKKMIQKSESKFVIELVNGISALVIGIIIYTIIHFGFIMQAIRIFSK